jgi:hypothetical protein
MNLSRKEAQRGQPQPKEFNHPDSESGDFTDKKDVSTQSRQDPKTQRRKELSAVLFTRIAHSWQNFSNCLSK